MIKPLLIRLPNWIGDVMMVLPSLRVLESHGYDLQLIGKAWAPSLLSGEHWPVHVYPRKHGERVQLLKSLAQQARQRDENFDRRINAITFPNSFSSAWELRAAGLRACGYRQDLRRVLLAKSFALPKAAHQLVSYWQLITGFLQLDSMPPATLDLQVASDAQTRTDTLIQTHQLQQGYIVLCPFAQGQLHGQSKKWPAFAEFAQRAKEFGLPLIVCPGPDEEQEAQASFAGCLILSGVKLSDYAALLKRASLVISNDTGPGHIAAGVGAKLISVLGPTDPKRYGPWGTTVTIINSSIGWPEVAPVLAKARALLNS